MSFVTVIVMRKCYTTLGLMFTQFVLMLALTSVMTAQVVNAPDSSGDAANTNPASTTAKTQTKIRALAVVEFSGDEPSSGKYRLVPISVFTNGAYRDGESYLANPVPLALQDGVIYEVQESGKPLGYATVNRSGQTGKEDARAWYGIGMLQKTAPDAMAKAAPSKITLSNSEEHRVYMPDSKKDKRRGRKDKDQGKNKPDAQPSSGSGSKPDTAGGDQKPPVTDADRPTLKKRPPETKTNQEKIDQASETKGQPVLPPEAVNDDPNRPHLTRGKPANSPEAVPEAVALSGEMHALVAVSDPNNKEAHPYRFEFDAQEEKSYRDKMITLAVSEAKRAHPEVALPPSVQWQDVNVRAYNLSLDNVATLVLTATIPASDSSAPPQLARKTSAKTRRSQPPIASRPQSEQYITLVARVDLEGEVRRTFIQVTDSSRFDIAPRMTLVDAVDADGDGRGELLFRLQSDQGTGWGIYRAGPDELTKLFDTFPAGD